jgi:arylsulfatase A-like enzyme
LLAGVRKVVDETELVVVFTADHGESLGEHNYWGHGRYLYEPSLRIPLGIIWKGHIPAATVASQATLLDIAPTALALAGIDAPPDLPGANWASTARNGTPVPEAAHCYQAHRGAVHGGSHDSDRKRSKGLLSVGIVDGDRKEILRLNPQELELYDLTADPGELKNLSSPRTKPSDQLLSCLAEVTDGYGNLDRLTTQKLDAETVEQLRALGYLE